MAARILVIDDDARLAEMVRTYLGQAGFAVETRATGLAGVDAAVAVRAGGEPFDAVILDIMLPDLDGLEVCRRIRERSDVPILMLTARGEDTDRIVGLDLGADDYLAKPFNPRELQARLNAVLVRPGRRRGAALPIGLAVGKRQPGTAMKTKITEMFGIQHPIIQGGMHFVGFAELAAAVSNAGGLGIITGLTQGTPDKLAREIARCREMTDKPFGVNLTFLPVMADPDYPGFIRAIIDGGVKAVETAGNNPQKWLPPLKEAGIKVIHKCTAVRHALKAQSIGCDAVSVDGFECGGHPGEDDVPNMILLPRAADTLKIPFVASGGMADARSLVAALAMGAEGMNMGTRFIATKEAPVHDNVKQAIVNASELDTRLVMRPLRNTERVLTNAAVERLLAKERELGAAIKFEDIVSEVAGVYPKIMLEGDMDAGAWSCGMVAGLIDDIPTCKELIDRIMSEAEAIIRGRLEGLLAA